MTQLQRQAKALGDPTRHAVFRYVVESAGPVGVAELTDHFGFNHNAIRQHLSKLVDADLLVDQTVASGGRGRPRLMYTPHPSADARWGTVGPYERLSWLLINVMTSGATPIDVGREDARRRSRQRPADPIEALDEEMSRRGFEPEVRRRGASGFELVLGNCPFASAAVRDPDTVCDLHLGMALGVADQIDGLVVDDLVRKNPTRGKCRLRCHTEP